MSSEDPKQLVGETHQALKVTMESIAQLIPPFIERPKPENFSELMNKIEILQEIAEHLSTMVDAVVDMIENDPDWDQYDTQVAEDEKTEQESEEVKPKLKKAKVAVSDKKAKVAKEKKVNKRKL